MCSNFFEEPENKTSKAKQVAETQKIDPNKNPNAELFSDKPGTRKKLEKQYEKFFMLSEYYKKINIIKNLSSQVIGNQNSRVNDLDERIEIESDSLQEDTDKSQEKVILNYNNYGLISLLET